MIDPTGYLFIRHSMIIRKIGMGSAPLAISELLGELINSINKQV